MREQKDLYTQVRPYENSKTQAFVVTGTKYYQFSEFMASLMHNFDTYRLKIVLSALHEAAQSPVQALA